jgi:NitT/TauT family transport system substrate-binding protein
MRAFILPGISVQFLADHSTCSNGPVNTYRSLSAFLSIFTGSAAEVCPGVVRRREFAPQPRGEKLLVSSHCSAIIDDIRIEQIGARGMGLSIHWRRDDSTFVTLIVYSGSSTMGRNRAMKFKSILSALIVLALFTSLAFAQGKNLERFILSNSTLAESRAPLYIAKDTGLFEKYGLDVQLVNIRGAAINTAALLAGEIQMTVAASAVTITAAARGAPIVTIATIGPTEYILVSRPPINSIQQLKGKTIGIAGFGAGDFFALRRLLPKLGLSIDKDVSLLPTGFTSPYDRMNIMFAGKLDGVMSTKNAVARIELQGKKLNILTGTEEQGVEVSGGDFITTREFLRTRPNQVKAILRAFSDAVKMGRENRDLFYRAIRKYMKEDNQQLLDAYYESHYFLGSKPHNARPLERSMDLDINDLSATVPELTGKKASDFIDDSVLREVEQEGFFSWAKH